MYGKLYTILAALLVAFALQPSSLRAQEAGLFSSPKGVGAVFRLPQKDNVFHSATFYVDVYGVITSRCSYPGYKLNLSRQYVFKRFQRDGYSMTLYAGPGISAGFVRDHDKRRGIDFSSLMSDNQGLMFALSGDAGCRFDFDGRVALDLSFTAEAGVHVRRNEREQNYPATYLSVYNNGLMQVLYPQLTILFNIK